MLVIDTRCTLPRSSCLMSVFTFCLLIVVILFVVQSFTTEPCSQTTMKATVLIALAIAYHSAAAQDSCPTQPRHSADKQGIDSVVSQSANFDEFPEGTSGKPLGE